jgi:hypothetical protein
MSKPPWWRAFDKVERAVGEPLEELVASPTYIDVMVAGMKVQRAIGRAVFRRAGGAVETLLHVVQVPSRGDIRRLNQQISSLATEVRALAVEQERARRRVGGADGD